MADSNITKRALASALKELMAEIPFDKINVSHICDKCGMNRKSFYYHFKDKYDLVNWIYDTEFIDLANKRDYGTEWNFLEDLCDYLGEHKEFYRRALKIKGQNSFSDHFTELLQPIIAEQLREIWGNKMVNFYVLFFTDALVGTIKRWIIEMDDISSDEFMALLKSCIEQVATKVYRDMNANDKATFVHEES